MANQALPSITTLFRQLLWGVAIFVVLSVITGVLVGALLINGAYVAYHSLLLNGLEPPAAQAITGVVLLLITGLLYSALHIKIQQLQNAIQRLLRMQSPIASRLNDITGSFMDGLLDRPEPKN